MSKENLRAIIVIIVVSMIALLSFGLVIGQLIEKEYIYETLVIVISFIGIFATFGGAYLGAKIAGDNARKLYEHQKKQKNYEKISKVELLTNIKLIEVLNHSKIVENDIELLYVDKIDKRDFKDIVERNVINPNDVIDGYAKPIIELLEDREIYNGTSELYKSLIKMFNECNRMKQHIEIIDINDKDLGHPEDFYILKEQERKMILEIYNDYSSRLRKDIVSTFAEYKFMKNILDQCIQNVLKNIADENKLVNDVKFHKFSSLKYSINLKGRL